MTMLLEISTHIQDDGSVELIASAGGHAWRRGLDGADLAERARWTGTILQAQAEYERVSYWRASRTRDEDDVGHLDAQYRELYAWDLQSIVQPLFAEIERRFPGERWLVVGEGRPCLPLFNVRSALRVGALYGTVPTGALAAFCAVHAWAGRGCTTLGSYTGPDALPQFRGPSISILLAQPPDELSGYFARLAPRRGPTMLIRDSLDWEAWKLADMLARDDWQAEMRDALAEAAQAVGARLRPSATRADLADVLAIDDPDALVVLVAHQDQDGIALADGPVGIPELAGYLHELRARGVRPCASADLGVCHAESEMNLADCLQAFGSPVVHTHGHYAHFGRVLTAWIWALRALADGAPRSLPTLLDDGWVHGLAAQRV